MNKQTIFITISLLFLSLLFACQPKEGFTVIIKAKQLANESLVLHYTDVNNQDIRHDFILDQNGIGEISHKKNIKENTFCRIIVKGKSMKSKMLKDYELGAYFFFFASNGSKIMLNGENFDEGNSLVYSIQAKNKLNSEVNDFVDRLNEKTLRYRVINKQLYELKDKFFKKLEGKDLTDKQKTKALWKTEKWKSLITVFRKETSIYNFTTDYIKDNNNSLSSYLLSYLYEKRALDLKFVEAKLKKYPEDIAQNFYLQSVEKLIEQRTAFSEGKTIDKLVKTTLTGETFNIKNVKKDYILIDFWATWCCPCKAGLPKMKKMLEANKNRLELVGVCCKDKEEKWRDYLKKNSEFDWIQILDENDELVEKFNIEGFPTKILLNKQGKIIYRVLGEHPEEYAKLEKIIQGK